MTPLVLCPTCRRIRNGIPERRPAVLDDPKSLVVIDFWCIDNCGTILKREAAKENL